VVRKEPLLVVVAAAVGGFCEACFLTLSSAMAVHSVSSASLYVCMYVMCDGCWESEVNFVDDDLFHIEERERKILLASQTRRI
jgi:hypothetical protein